MKRTVTLSVCLLLFNACSATQYSSISDQSASQKPWFSFQAQLSIIESAHRWQVLLDWQADSQSGSARLTHAATGRIIKLRWQGNDVQILDNQAMKPNWKYIKADALMKYGIVLPPHTIAAILQQQIPKQLKPQGTGIWKGLIYGNSIRLRWQNNGHKLTMTDITHGRTAILRILP
ncbi:MAG: hypothetical protein Q9M20_03475 [Mariprofundaceae bacterium]|nr:hypothetical protein [Mariprofundaceae bacterium]